ncbi:testis-expressed protein 13D-like [Manis javanica]|uniref:testis-expressed protein 13D-like n=1 Tax=Manis javanica TaxID=9974 RepID=UPI003C6D8F57
MAVNLNDPKSGFRCSEVIKFLNEQLLSNGGSNFYETFSSLSWNEIEYELLCILNDPQISRSKKMASAWSALALSVRVAKRQEEQQAHCIEKLKEELGKREAATWALASQLQLLLQERQIMIAHLHWESNHRQQALNEREALRKQLLQTNNRQPSEVAPRFGALQLTTEGCPVKAKQNGVVAAARLQHENLMMLQRKEFQMAPAAGLLSVPQPQTPWGQVGEPRVATPLPMQSPVAFPYPRPRPTRLVSEEQAWAERAFPPQMPTGRIYPAGVWPAVGTQERVALQGDQRSQGQKEGPVWSHLPNPSGHSCSQGNQKKQESQGQMPYQPRALGILCKAEKDPDPSV